MTLSYGFYDSVSSDRLYNAQQMGMIFDGIINDGVYASIGDKFFVVEDSGMDIGVGSGRAWFDHTWTYNDAEVGLTVDTADALLDRIDVVYLEVNENTGTRANSVDILTGTPASSPVAGTLTNTATVHQYALAHIYVIAGATDIYTANITNKVGLTETPFVTGPLSIITTNEILAQWEAEWEDWFEAIQDQLSEEAETNLQAQIWAIVGDTDPPPLTLLELEVHDHIGGDGNPIAEGALANLAVSTAKLQNDAVTASKIADNAVSDVNAGNRIIQFYRRQGGNATNWSTAGTTNYVPTTVRQQAGSISFAIANGLSKASQTITFPVAFDNAPLVFVTLLDPYDHDDITIYCDLPSSTQMVITAVRPGTSGTDSIWVNWQAIGPE